MKYTQEQIQFVIDLVKAGNPATSSAIDMCKHFNLEYKETTGRLFRKKVNKLLKKIDPNLENDTTTDTNQYSNTAPLSALKPDGSIMTVKEYCDHYKLPFEEIRTYKLVTHGGKQAYYNLASNAIKTEGYENFYNRLLEDISKINNLPTTLIRSKESLEKESYLLVIDPCDIHIGKLAESFETGEDYDSQIAVQRVKEGVEGILDKVSGFNIDKILFIGGNDILHIDTPKRTTTSGTPQDTSGSWYGNFLLAKQLYIEVLNRLLTVSDVHFVHNPSNHDWVSSFFLADVIQTYFKDCRNITFDCSINHRKYFTYGKNLIGSTHGDSAKPQDLPLLMAHEAKEWSESKHKYIYTHHVHHKSSKDYMGVNVEAMRSASGTDGWHHRAGYAHAPKAIEGFLHSKEFGQIARITHLF